MTHQVSLTIIAKIKPGSMDDLKQLLGMMSKDVRSNHIIPFGEFSQVHFARFVILEEDRDLDNKVIQPSLVFSSEIDASLERYYNDLVTVAGGGLDQIYSHCEGYLSLQQRTASNRIAYLRQHQVNAQAFYVNTVGRTVQQVCQEADLRDKIEHFLEDHYKPQWGAAKSDATTIRRAIQDFVKQKPDLAWALTPVAPPNLGWQIRENLHFISGLLLILLLGLVFLPISPIFFAILRWKEETDPHPRQDPNFRLSQFHRIHLAQDEDFFSQNQFSVLGFIKPGWFRYITLRVILWLINFAVRHIFNNGDLGTVPLLNLNGVDTIHFAKWVVIDQGRRELFMSNYDGDLEDYMNDFINKVAWGLNIAFSHGVDYPKTRWLVKGGARDEQVYKAVLRKHQIRSQVWYAAYPNLSAINISNNAQIRAGLFQPLDAAEQQAWLSRF